MKFHLGEVLIEQVKSISPEFPIMVMEFWAGWFDHWEHTHAYSLAKRILYLNYLFVYYGKIMPSSKAVKIA
jgi:hypothetical protein